MDVADPIQQAEDRLAGMLLDNWDGVTAEQAEAGRAAAHKHQTCDDPEAGVLNHPRSLGFSQIADRPKGDAVQYVVAVTDGVRDAAIVVLVSGTRLAVLTAHNEDASEHLIERLNGITGSFPNDGRRYENLLAQDQPLHL